MVSLLNGEKPIVVQHRKDRLKNRIERTVCSNYGKGKVPKFPNSTLKEGLFCEVFPDVTAQMVRKSRTKAVPKEGRYWLINGTASNRRQLAPIIEQRTSSRAEKQGSWIRRQLAPSVGLRKRMDYRASYRGIRYPQSLFQASCMKRIGVFLRGCREVNEIGSGA